VHLWLLFCSRGAVIMLFRPERNLPVGSGATPMSHRTRALLVLISSIAILSSAVAWQGATKKAEPATELLPVLQDSGPRWWKGNLHTHSFWSDGDDFPEMIADWYKRH